MTTVSLKATVVGRALQLAPSATTTGSLGWHVLHVTSLELSILQREGIRRFLLPNERCQLHELMMVVGGGGHRYLGELLTGKAGGACPITQFG